jgi:excisionase family DNA binding protein
MMSVGSEEMVYVSRCSTDRAGKTTGIDETVYRLFQQLLVDLAQNRAVSIIPVDHELTSHQAAELLNVSRPYLISLLDQRKIPFRMVGTHRRIRLEDLLAYKDKTRADSDKALDELARESQENGTLLSRASLHRAARRLRALSCSNPRPPARACDHRRVPSALDG